MQNISKIFGSSLIVAGTAIGASMLAMPIASSSIGFLSSTFFLIFMCILSTYTALVTLEINTNFENSLSISRIVTKYYSKLFGWFSMLVLASLFYSLLAAYISGISEITQTCLTSYYNIQISDYIIKFIIILIIGLLVSSCTKAVDLGNRLFFILKIIIFIIMIAVFLPKIQVDNFILKNEQNLIFSGLTATIPVIFTAFGFHGSIPVILKYLDNNTRYVKYSFILGSCISLVVYLLWQMIVFGILPIEGEISFQTIKDSNNSLGVFIDLLSEVGETPFLKHITSAFSWVAIITSLVGVGIGLFDFFQERNKDHDNLIKRFKSGLLTFIPPFLISILAQELFIKALSFAAISLSILAIILPTTIAYKLRKANKTKTYKYQAPGGKIVLILALLFGIAIIAFVIINLLKIT